MLIHASNICDRIITRFVVINGMKRKLIEFSFAGQGEGGFHIVCLSNHPTKFVMKKKFGE